MKAWFGGTGTSWQLRDLPVPDTEANQVLVKVGAAALNRADAVRARPGESFLAGYEFSGEIVAIGDRSFDDLLGLRVIGSNPGAFAEYVALDNRLTLPAPAGMSAAVAAALPVSLLTGFAALEASEFSRGDRVLITGATSSVGLLALQIAFALGASRVIGAIRSQTAGERVAALGAQPVVVSRHPAVDLQRVVGAQGVDTVLDLVGGTLLRDCLSVIAPGGRLVSVGDLGGVRAEPDPGALADAEAVRRDLGFGLGDPTRGITTLPRAARLLEAALDAGRIVPDVAAEIGFDDAPYALERLRHGVRGGKLVLTGW